MNKIIIIADSTVDLSPELFAKNNVVVVPLNVNFGDTVYLDNKTITPDEVYAKVKETNILPKTSAIGPTTLGEIFKKYIDEGYDVLFTGIGSTMSSTYQNANIAKEELPANRIFIIDSKNLSTGSGLLVLKMAKLRDEGLSAKEIYEQILPLVNKLSVQFAVDSLDYLHKGGRCSGATKLIGTLFHVHPIIKVMDGVLNVYKKPRGPYKVALNELVNEIQNDYPNIDLDNVMVTHSGIDQGIIDYLVEAVGNIVGKEHVRVTRAGCVISSHCGPNTIGVLYIKK